MPILSNKNDAVQPVSVLRYHAYYNIKKIYLDVTTFCFCPN